MVANNPNCPPPEPRGKTHGVYLIELALGLEGDQHFYFSVDYDGEGDWWVVWTEDVNRAIQYTREQDAAKMRAGILVNTQIKVSKVLVSV